MWRRASIVTFVPPTSRHRRDGVAARDCRDRGRQSRGRAWRACSAPAGLTTPTRGGGSLPHLCRGGAEPPEATSAPPDERNESNELGWVADAHRARVVWRIVHRSVLARHRRSSFRCGEQVALVGPGHHLAEEGGREGVGLLAPDQLRGSELRQALPVGPRWSPLSPLAPRLELYPAPWGIWAGMCGRGRPPR